jgi:hypothetical protein
MTETEFDAKTHNDISRGRYWLREGARAPFAPSRSGPIGPDPASWCWYCYNRALEALDGNELLLVALCHES